MNSDINMGSKIRNLRKQKNLTQKELGERIHVTDKAVSKWELGKGYPDIETLPLLAKALDISTSELFIHDEEESSTTETAVNNTLNYAKQVENMKDKFLIKILVSGIGLMLFLGILTCLVVDISSNKTVTWSVIPTFSMILVWLISMSLLLTKRKPIVSALLAFSALLIPYLWVISRATPSVDWFVPIALPIAITAIIMLWVIYACAKTKLSKFTLITLIFLFIPIMDMVVDLALKRSLAEHFMDGWKIFTLTISILVSIAMFLVGKVYKKKTQSDEGKRMP